MPQTEKFPIGSRVSGKVEFIGGPVRSAGNREVPMRVLGYDGLKFVIVEVLQDVGTWKKGKVALMPAKNLTLREEVKHIPGEPEEEGGHAIGWMELGGLSVALTRDHNGTLLIAIEKSPEAPEDLLPIPVRISKQDGGHPDLWEGVIES